MKLTARHYLYLGAAVLTIILAFAARDVLGPFFLAAIFAYLLNPAVTFIAERIRVPRPVAILVVYIAIIFTLFLLIMVIGRNLIIETREFAHEARVILTGMEKDKGSLPEWFSPYADDFTTSLKNSISFSSQQIIKLFSGALSSLISVFIFLLSLFYFLKEGRQFISFVERLLPKDAGVEFAIVAGKINKILGNYLLAQFSLVCFMAVVSSIIFFLLGVRYALILGLIVGLAELLPIVGPTFAFFSVIFITAIGGGATKLPILFVYQPFVVAVIYLLINQLENILVVPQVTGRMVKLHPLLILVSVMIGGHFLGAIGFLIIVPFVASLKVVLEHVFDRLQKD